MKKAFGFVVFVGIVLGAAFLLNQFLLDNPAGVQLRFFQWRTKEVSMGTLVCVIFLFGLVAPFLMMFGPYVSKTVELKRLHKENEALQTLVDEAKKRQSEVAHSSSSK